MAITEVYTGSASITATEYSLPNASTTLTGRTDDFLGDVFIDLGNLVVGDDFLIRVKEKVTSGGTQRVVWQVNAVGARDVIVIPALSLIHGWDVTIQRMSSTNRTISWSFRSVL